jgi:hypothetical protein
LKSFLPTALRPGRRQRGFIFFFEKTLCRALLAKAFDKDGFSIFFEKILCREPLAKAVGKGCFSIFFEKNPMPRAPGKGRRQRRFFIFLK